MIINIVLEDRQGNRRVVPSNTTHLPGERVVGTEKRDELYLMAQEQSIGVGDLIAAILTSTGFKKWWKETHEGDCLPCQYRQAVYNYLRFQGPRWLSAWVKKVLKNDS